MSKKKNSFDGFPAPLKEKTYDIFAYHEAPDKCANVLVITHKYTYQGTIRAHAKQDGVVKKVLVENDSIFRGSQWESVHDVFEVE